MHPHTHIQIRTLGRRPVHRPAGQGGQARVDEAFAEARVQDEGGGEGHGAGADVVEGLVVFVFWLMCVFVRVEGGGGVGGYIYRIMYACIYNMYTNTSSGTPVSTGACRSSSPCGWRIPFLLRVAFACGWVDGCAVDFVLCMFARLMIALALALSSCVCMCVCIYYPP